MMNTIPDCLAELNIIADLETDADTQGDYRPRTALGRKLLSLRLEYIESGGKLLDEGEFEAELCVRRGGLGA